MTDNIFSLMVSLISGWALVNPQIHEGLIIKIGLAFVSIGALIQIEDPAATGIVNFGILICAIGLLIKHKKLQ